MTWFRNQVFISEPDKSQHHLDLYYYEAFDATLPSFLPYNHSYAVFDKTKTMIHNLIDTIVILNQRILTENLEIVSHRKIYEKDSRREDIKLN